jgi:catechol 2,3-dioxygenase-like lactoylglutathione lyase family enzyme
LFIEKTGMGERVGEDPGLIYRMIAKYKHTNIISSNWQSLSRFYQEAFGCIPVPPQRDLSGKWLEAGTGVKGARFAGIHLRLPGYGENGPTLEIYQYSENLAKSFPAANREGFGHIAFEVDDVRKAAKEVLEHGGARIGEIASKEIEGVGFLTFVYLADPEGNIIELQAWE